MNQEFISIIDDLIKLSGESYIKTNPPTDSLIESYQKDIGFVFSDEYKFFLKNASTILYGTKDPLIITQDKSSRSELSIAILEGRRMGLPNDWLPICEDNGDYYCITPDGTVRFWTSNGSTDEKWPNLGDWIKEVWMNQG